jgi:hypothetical protein
LGLPTINLWLILMWAAGYLIKNVNWGGKRRGTNN